jgi:hypothetical protein
MVMVTKTETQTETEIATATVTARPHETLSPSGTPVAILQAGPLGS